MINRIALLVKIRTYLLYPLKRVKTLPKEALWGILSFFCGCGDLLLLLENSEDFFLYIY